MLDGGEALAHNLKGSKHVWDNRTQMTSDLCEDSEQQLKCETASVSGWSIADSYLHQEWAIQFKPSSW